jgi:hypothetical protein
MRTAGFSQAQEDDEKEKNRDGETLSHLGRTSGARSPRARASIVLSVRRLVPRSAIRGPETLGCLVRPALQAKGEPRSGIESALPREADLRAQERAGDPVAKRAICFT